MKQIFKTTKVRVLVNRTNKHFYLQAIESSGKILGSVMSGKDDKNTVAGAKALGKRLAEELLAKKTKTVVFVKGNYKYHGRVKAAAEGLREGGLAL